VNSWKNRACGEEELASLFSGYGPEVTVHANLSALRVSFYEECLTKIRQLYCDKVFGCLVFKEGIRQFLVAQGADKSLSMIHC